MPTAIYAELLQDANDAQVKRFMEDNNCVWQEKHNGDRRVVSKIGNTIIDYNRGGERGKGLSPNVIAALKKHPLHQFIIDGEFVGTENKLYVFDALHLGDYNVQNSQYRERLQYIHASFDGFHPDIVPIESAFTPEEKIALFEHLRNIRAEGFVMKDLSAPYRESNRGGSLRWNYRYKFVKTCDCIVLGPSPNGHDSVRVGVYDEAGKLCDIGGVTCKSAIPLTTGDIVEVKYLWASRNRHLNQPRLLRKRMDKGAKECTMNQLVIAKNQ